MRLCFSIFQSIQQHTQSDAQSIHDTNYSYLSELVSSTPHIRAFLPRISAIPLLVRLQPCVT